MAEFTNDDRKNLKTACDFIIKMEPIVEAVSRHDQEIRSLELEDVRQGSAIAGVKQDTKSAHARISDIKKMDMADAKAGGKSWENAFWKVFAIVVVLSMFALEHG